MLGRVKLEKTSSERVSQPFQITLPSSFADICNSFFGNSMIRKPKRSFLLSQNACILFALARGIYSLFGARRQICVDCRSEEEAVASSALVRIVSRSWEAGKEAVFGFG